MERSGVTITVHTVHTVYTVHTVTGRQYPAVVARQQACNP
eukprot:COSAG01_NODE_51583_length_353_cov_1.838583_1_plen_39_part_10